jgi:predicted RNA-binding protein with PUA-like domain
MKQCWLVKSEPSAYSWNDLVADGKTAWTGVRNFTARNNLRAMRKGDAVLFYHSVVGKEVVGIAKVVKEAYPDPTAKEGEWSAADLAPEKPLAQPVTLEAIKRNPKMKEMALLRLSRLSVQPVTAEQFDEVLRMGR